MKLWSTLFAVILLLGTLFWTIPALAGEPDDSSSDSAGIIDRYPMVPDPCPLDNTLNPLSPNYNPDNRYGGEGTRFGPPGKRVDTIETAGVDWLTHHYYGTKLNQNSLISGVDARHYFSTTLSLKDSSDYLYAPTLMAPNNCALESVTYYHRTSLGINERRWKIWSHLTEAFVYDTPLDSTFQSKYSGTGGYRTKIEKSGTTWAVYIFNYTTSQWENKWQVTGSPTDHADGWCFWEEYDLDNNWPTLPKIQASYVMVKRSDLGSWFLATSTYAGVYQSAGFPPSGFPYPYGWTSQYYNWYVGPN